MKLDRYGLSVGPWLLMVAPRGEGDVDPDDMPLHLLKRDFRDVRFRVRWPWWLWPYRQAQLERFAGRIAPALVRERDGLKGLVEECERLGVWR